MNGISSPSLWWIILHRDYYLRQGDLAYLKEQQAYLKSWFRMQPRFRMERRTSMVAASWIGQPQKTMR